MKIGLVDVFVDDQDRRRDVYATVLGLGVNDSLGASCLRPRPPTTGSRGIDAVVEDGCGNLLNLHHAAPGGAGG